MNEQTDHSHSDFATIGEMTQHGDAKLVKHRVYSDKNPDVRGVEGYNAYLVLSVVSLLRNMFKPRRESDDSRHAA
jgi:hypothetical protein